jgi:hypothetical protein
MSSCRCRSLLRPGDPAFLPLPGAGAVRRLPEPPGRVRRRSRDAGTRNSPSRGKDYAGTPSPVRSPDGVAHHRDASPARVPRAAVCRSSCGIARPPVHPRRDRKRPLEGWIPSRAPPPRSFRGRCPHSVRRPRRPAPRWRRSRRSAARNESTSRSAMPGRITGRRSVPSR